MGTIKALFTFLFSTTIGLSIAVLTFLSLPLNVLVWMRWMQWEWWTAIIATIGSMMIPAIGHITYLVFTLMGAYYMYDANWSWRLAVNPALKTFKVEDLSAKEFEVFKRQNIQPAIEAQCIEQVKTRYTLSGRIPESSARMCECIARVTVDATTQHDLIHQETLKSEPPGARQRIQRRLEAECRN
jgi:hypothetical protein